jgi:lysophospholipid acyltransferase (LPLAT)-like uncharacterized protein
MAAYPFLAALARTLTWKVDGRPHFEALAAAACAPIFAFWHGRILPATYYWRDRGIVAMASENFDGEWIARLIVRFGYGVARGSTSRGGSRALVQLRRGLEIGRPAAFTVDGPRGPARVAQPGAVWLAGATGHPVLPFHIEASRYWAARSWDRTMVPKPFSRAAIAIGEPLYVPDTSGDTVERCRRELESRLAALEGRCRTLLAG